MNKKNKSLKNTGLFLAFAGPAVFAFMAVVIIPFLYGFYLTFTSWDGLSKSKPFVGLANYAELFKDTGFWQALGLTLIYVVVSVVLVNVVAFLLALLVTGKLRGKSSSVQASSFRTRSEESYLAISGSSFSRPFWFISVRTQALDFYPSPGCPPRYPHLLP